MRIRDGAARHRAAHLRRLQEALDFLGASRAWLDEAFEAALANAPEGVLRVRVAVEERKLLTRLEAWSPLPSPYRLRPAPHPLGESRGDPAARHKGLRGGWSAEALAFARSRDVEDLLCLWPDGTLAETAIAAVAVEDGLNLRVPPLEGRVASIAEAEELPRWAEARGRILVRGPVPFREIAGKGLLCFNAARGVWQAEVLPPAEP
jgi:branched-subunit amino acid aminotransferase/4-amino-4-deoxychorismate lyase